MSLGDFGKFLWKVCCGDVSEKVCWQMSLGTSLLLSWRVCWDVFGDDVGCVNPQRC